MVPVHLNDISILTKNNKFFCKLKIQCKCSCNRFIVFIYQDSNENHDSYTKHRVIVKIVCEKCGSEYIIFDNFKHGYDAVANKYMQYNVEALLFKKVYEKPLFVFLKIYQNLSFLEMKEELGEINVNDYLNSFDFIEIYGRLSKFKKIKIHSEETA